MCIGEVEVTDVDQDLEVLAHRHVVEDVGAGLGQGDLGLVDAVRCDSDPQPSARCGGPGTHSRPRTSIITIWMLIAQPPLGSPVASVASSQRVRHAWARRTHTLRTHGNMNGPRQPSMFGARSRSRHQHRCADRTSTSRSITPARLAAPRKTSLFSLPVGQRGRGGAGPDMWPGVRPGAPEAASSTPMRGRRSSRERWRRSERLLHLDVQGGGQHPLGLLDGHPAGQREAAAAR